MPLPYLYSANLSSQMKLFLLHTGSLKDFLSSASLNLSAKAAKLPTHANWANVNFILLSYAHACS